MAVIPYLYRRMVALGIPHSQAELFADQSAEFPSEGGSMTTISQLDTDTELLESVVAKVNEMIVGLQAAGLMDEEA